MCTILVTGGAGFIGSHLVDSLIDEGHNVVILDNLSTGQKENLNPKAIFIERNIQDDLSNLFEKYKFKYIFHTAAQINLRRSLQSPKEDAETNIVGSLNLIENAIKYKVEKFIFSSTGGAIYSAQAPLPCIESSEKVPESPYGLAKFSIENYLRIMKHVHGLNYVSLRYSNVYGPRQNAKGEAGVIAIFIEKALANQDLTIFGAGNKTRDYVFVQDVVKANLLARNLEGEFNVSTNHETDVNEIANKILELTNSNSKIIHGAEIPGELERSRLSHDKLSSHGWHPQTQLDKGIKETVDWFKSRQL